MSICTSHEYGSWRVLQEKMGELVLLYLHNLRHKVVDGSVVLITGGEITKANQYIEGYCLTNKSHAKRLIA
jgi:hypothetical protein